jgi:4-diphosphocytidyl-2-C-methyl-D-erythritol kinase
MISFPNAKINLGLFVTEKRKDNYHNIESIFVGIDWTDALEITLAEKPQFTINGVPQDLQDRSNLVLKSHDLLAQSHQLPPLAIHLIKKIPMGAGLGGGSSDASFALKLINKVAKLKYSNQELSNLSSLIGSDCPFFIENKISLVSGRGEIIKPMAQINLSHLRILLVNPHLHISTQQAYQGVIPTPNSVNLREILSSPVKLWAEKGLKNDFEASVFKQYPVLEEIKNQFYEIGASYAAMSGSGSTVFGLFENEIPKYKFPTSYMIHNGKLI